MQSRLIGAIEKSLGETAEKGLLTMQPDAVANIHALKDAMNYSSQIDALQETVNFIARSMPHREAS